MCCHCHSYQFSWQFDKLIQFTCFQKTIQLTHSSFWEHHISDHQLNANTRRLPPTLRRRRMVLQSLSGFSFSVSPRLLQLELCCCSSQHTHTPSLSNLSWGWGGGNTHPHSCMNTTYTKTHTRKRTRTRTHTHRHTHRSDLCLVSLNWSWWMTYLLLTFILFLRDTVRTKRLNTKYKKDTEYHIAVWLRLNVTD